MTLDKAIAHAREEAKEQRSRIGPWNEVYSKKCEVWAEEYEQLAEWLEELKFFKRWKSNIMDEFCKFDCNSVEKARHNAYNKAIDDFVKFANTMPTVDEEDGAIRPMRLEEMAEQLKAGIPND